MWANRFDGSKIIAVVFTVVFDFRVNSLRYYRHIPISRRRFCILLLPLRARKGYAYTYKNRYNPIVT